MGKKVKEISGMISQVKYRNDTGWCVFLVACNDGSSTEISCTGVLPEIADQGTECVCSGKFETNKFGKSLKCSSITIAAPRTDTASGVAKLLTRLPGIGPAKARAAIVEHGPEYAWWIAQNCPSMLGITNYRDAETAICIASTLIANYETLTYLMGIGLTDYQSGQISKEFGNLSRKTVAETPYALLQIDGFGFRTVDVIALKAGIRQNSTARIMAGVLHCLESTEKNDGNIWFYGRNLIAIVLEDLKEGAMKMSLPMIEQPQYEDVKSAIYILENEGKVYVEDGKVYSKKLRDDEQFIYDVLRESVRN